MRPNQIVAKLIKTDLRKTLKKYNYSISTVTTHSWHEDPTIMVIVSPPDRFIRKLKNYFSIIITPKCSCETYIVYDRPDNWYQYKHLVGNHNIADPNLTKNITKIILKHTPKESTVYNKRHHKKCQHYTTGDQHNLGPQCKSCQKYLTQPSKRPSTTSKTTTQK